MSNLDGHRLVYLAPASGVGGVGDYADDFADAVRPHFGEVVEYRHGAPGTDSVRDIARHRESIRRLVQDAPGGRAIVHMELSGGAVTPFWSTRGIDSVPVTATVHDPPGLVWWPGRTKFLADHRIVNHGLHFPLRAVSRRVERRVWGERPLFVLTSIGARETRRAFPDATVRESSLFVPPRVSVAPAEDRPRAVGFFGLVYRGKGFELIQEIRRRLPADIAVRVAGRGTESLPTAPGIEILGEVNGPDEDAFFASIRALVLPYGKRTIYGDAFPASSVATRAVAYRTPLVCSGYGSLTELESDGGAVVVDGGAAEIADAVADLVHDPVRVAALGREADALRAARTPEAVAATYVSVWADAVRDTAAVS